MAGDMVFQRLWGWLRGEEEELFVADWTPARAEKAEQATKKMLGRGETAYQWSMQYRKQVGSGNGKDTHNAPLESV